MLRSVGNRKAINYAYSEYEDDEESDGFGPEENLSDSDYKMKISHPQRNRMFFIMRKKILYI